MNEGERLVERAAEVARAINPRPAMTPEVAAMCERRDDTQLPPAVRNAVMLVNDYFSSRGITTFEIGPLCSRDHAIRLHRIKDILNP